MKHNFGRAISAAALFALASGAAAVDFTAFKSPIIIRGGPTAWYGDPAAIYTDGVFRLYYTFGRPEPDGRFYMYTAVSKSTNLVDWTEPRILTPRGLNLNFSSPGDVVRFGGEWILCVTSYPRPNGERYANDTARLWIMRSRDLENWSEPELLKVKGTDVPVEQMGRMIDPYLLQDKDDPGKWWCFYKQNGVSLSWSRDLKTWNYWGHVDAGENVCVLVEDGEYVMFHSPKNGIGVKRSKDLKTWRDDGLTILGQKDWDWAHGRLTAGFVLDLRKEPGVGKYLMFFHGSGPGTDRNSLQSLGLAWSDDLVNWNWPGKSVTNSPPSQSK
ncbi:MAG TPA: hypothetical protein VMV72_04565 [Verrucomicrobiae bacterium]|nr:hypothetical protein [Verrucomicrobiae bacterium]